MPNVIFFYRTLGIGLSSAAARAGGMVAPFARNLVSSTVAILAVDFLNIWFPVFEKDHCNPYLSCPLLSWRKMAIFTCCNRRLFKTDGSQL